MENKITKCRDHKIGLTESFSLLRFPLIAIVVLIHVFQDSEKYKVHGNSVFADYPNWFFDIMYFAGEALTRMAVPCFFFVSGYLFFYRVNDFNENVYAAKLKRRVHSLLIPYLLWSLLFWIVMIILNPESLDLTFDGLRKVFWGYNSCPLLFQFWYVRDLMVLAVFTPFIYFCLKKLKVVYMVLLSFMALGGGSLFNIGLFDGFSFSSLFYFSIGALMSLEKILSVCPSRWMFFILAVLYLTSAIFNTEYRTSEYGQYIALWSIFIGFVFWMYMGIYITSKGFRMKDTLTQSTFFIFAVHPFIVPVIKKCVFIMVIPDNPLLAVVLHYLIFAVSLVLCMLLGRVFMKLTPKIYKLTTGGR